MRNLVIRNGTYHFRDYLPHDLIAAGHPRERTESLRTTDRKAALLLRGEKRVAHERWIEEQRLRIGSGKLGSEAAQCEMREIGQLRLAPLDRVQDGAHTDRALGRRHTVPPRWPRSALISIVRCRISKSRLL